MGLVALGLSGCASVAAVNDNSGIVENAGSAKQALQKAEAHCAPTNRTAHATNYDALLGSMTFDCVAK